MPERVQKGQGTMRAFTFENATKIYFGGGCVKEHLLEAVKPYGETVMLAYGGGSIKTNGIYQEVMDVLKLAGKQVIEFSGIMPNPTYSKVMEGKKVVQENQVDLILAVGGGSVMDCCKAISLAARYEGDVWADFWARPGIIDFKPLPLGVIVTVAGTGSECNGGAVITNEDLKVKIIHSVIPNLPCLIRNIPTVFQSFKWFPAGLIPCPISWRFISVSRMRIMFRMTLRRH